MLNFSIFKFTFIEYLSYIVGESDCILHKVLVN